jgi:hypothetical protein
MPEELFMLYSAGPCSICGEMSEVLFAKSAASNVIFFLCPACGIAWEKPPQPFVVNSIDPVEEFAPKGILFPTKDDIISAGLGTFIQKELIDAGWLSLAKGWMAQK